MKKQTKGAESYKAECSRFGKSLPDTIKHICYVPKDPTEFRNCKPHNRTRYIKLLAHPDPPDYVFASTRGWLKYHSPNFFSAGAVKEVLKVEKATLMAWRKRHLRNYCKKNNLVVSSFLDPVEPDKPIFAPFGPKNNWIDKIDRQFRADDMSPGWIIKAICRALIFGFVIGMLLNWLLFVWNPVKEIFLSLIIIIIFDYLVGLVAKSVDHLSEMRRFNRNPVVFAYEKGKLSHLLRNLKAVERELKHYFPTAMTAIQRSRPHPNKKAYSIKLVSHLMLNELISPLFTRPEILTLNIEIVAENIKAPPILCYWFDAPKSILMAWHSVPLTNFIKDRMNEMIKDINEHYKFVLLRNTTDVDEKVTVAYGPFIFTV